MDYAIYKEDKTKRPRIIHRFKQQHNNHRAKAAAREKLNEMWLRVLDHPTLYRNAAGSQDEFQYDFMTSVNTSEHIRFFIDKL